MDDLSFRLGNRVLGNPEGAPGLECTRGGPGAAVLRRRPGVRDRRADGVTVDGAPVPPWQAVTVPAGGVLDVGALTGPGMRMLRAGGRRARSCPTTSAAQRPSPSGAFGGHEGGRFATATCCRRRRPGPHERRPTAPPGRDRRAAGASGTTGRSRVHRGAARGARVLHPRGHRHPPRHRLRGALQLRPHRGAARSGRSRSGPAPTAARPACIRRTSTTTPTRVGALDFTGDTPILLGPDGPSLGGFVCPVTVVGGERWKLGQLRPGDTVRFVPGAAPTAAPSLRDHRASSRRAVAARRCFGRRGDGDDGVLGRRDRGDTAGHLPARPATTVSSSSTATWRWIWRCGPGSTRCTSAGRRAGGPGWSTLTPGVRSLQVQVDPRRAAGRRG